MRSNIQYDYWRTRRQDSQRAFDVFYKFLHTLLHAEFTEEVDEYSDLAVIPEGMAVHFPYSCKASLPAGLPRRFTDIGEH